MRAVACCVPRYRTVGTGSVEIKRKGDQTPVTAASKERRSSLPGLERPASWEVNTLYRRCVRSARSLRPYFLYSVQLVGAKAKPRSRPGRCAGPLAAWEGRRPRTRHVFFHAAFGLPSERCRVEPGCKWWGGERPGAKSRRVQI